MNIKVVYYSKGGNTAKVAGAIASGAIVEPEKIEEVNLNEKVDIMFIGGSIYAGEISPKLAEFVSELSADTVKKIVVFGTSVSKKTPLKQITEILKDKGIEVVQQEFHCKGSFLFVNRHRPNEQDLLEAESFAAKIIAIN